MLTANPYGNSEHGSLEIDDGSDTKYGYVGILPSNNKTKFEFPRELVAFSNNFAPYIPEGTRRTHVLEDWNED